MHRDPRQRFRALLEPVHDDARAFARRLCRTSADGDDVFHDAIIRAQRKLETLRDDRAFRSWLYRVIVTVHRTRTRRSFWRRLSPLSGQERATGSPSPLDRDESDRVREALAALSTVQREAIVLFELEGMAVDEVASVQQVSASAVKSRLARGRHKLRTVYVKRFGIGSADSELVKGTS